jgi:hypothetical protein
MMMMRRRGIMALKTVPALQDEWVIVAENAEGQLESQTLVSRMSAGH